MIEIDSQADMYTDIGEGDIHPVSKKHGNGNQKVYGYDSDKDQDKGQTTGKGNWGRPTRLFRIGFWGERVSQRKGSICR